MFKPGDIVVAMEFAGVKETKRRPVVVVSSLLYQKYRPDVIVGQITTQIAKANAPTDCLIEDWKSAGLDRPSAFRSFLLTIPVDQVKFIGRLTPTDWMAVKECMRLALETK